MPVQRGGLLTRLGGLHVLGCSSRDHSVYHDRFQDVSLRLVLELDEVPGAALSRPKPPERKK